MPQAMTAGQIFKVRVWCTSEGQASVNTIGGVVQSVTGGGAITDLQLAQALDTEFAALYPPILWNSATYDGVQVQIVAPPQLYLAQFSNTHSAAGTAGTTALPKQTAGLISFGTTLAGRAFRGRWYMPFPAAANDTGTGIPNAGYETALANITSALSTFQSLVSGGTTLNWLWSLIHRKDKAGLTPVPTPIISYKIADLWATQRRRGDFGRLNKSPI